MPVDLNGGDRSAEDTSWRRGKSEMLRKECVLSLRQWGRLVVRVSIVGTRIRLSTQRPHKSINSNHIFAIAFPCP